MKYYIVMNEWNYPTESDREYVGDYDTREEAIKDAYSNWAHEQDNFQEVTNGWYSEACGPFHDDNGDVAGFMMHSSQWEQEDFMFRSVIIEREVI